jgi:hypothetical protein
MSDEELKALEEMAAALLTDAELEAFMELDKGTIAKELRSAGSAIGKAVKTGRLRTKVEHNISVITSGRRHSTPAQNMVAGMLKDIALQ